MTSSLRTRWRGAIAFVAVLGLVGASLTLGAAAASPAHGHLRASAADRHLAAQGSAKVTEFATGFNNPRGLRFGPNGKLYVAEGGKGGSLSSVGACPQVVEPVGPYSGGYTGRISVVSHEGHRRTLIEHLPSSQTSPALGGLVSGVADVEFIGHHLYALLAGAGCSHGLVGTNNKILSIRGHHKE
jgi:glucose/arabinose dehydrogenase